EKIQPKRAKANIWGIGDYISLQRLDNTEALSSLKRACFDCHSYETHWPWYSHIAPFSLLIERDVKLARARLNFSEWEDLGGKRKKKLAKKVIKSIEEDTMPLWTYSLLHPEAALEKPEKDRIIEAFAQTAE
ncbi:MAG: heme-binding domain-containing protein, partial [Oligoflexales bacterium]|nr:heme-binding domain-containing protein [Oligoflexales bacterium]